MLKKEESLPLEVAVAAPPSSAIGHAAPLTPRERWLADASLMLTAILWGINIPVVKTATLSLDPIVFNALRMVLSTIVLGAFAWLESRWKEQPANGFSRMRFVIFALVSGLVYPLMFMVGIDYTTAGNTALLLSSMPLWTAVISAIFIRERLPLLTWVSLFIAFVGTAVVIAAGGKVSMSTANFTGNLLMLASAMLWASGTVISGPLLKQITPLRLAFLSSLLTTPLHLLIVSRQLPEELPKLAQWQSLAAVVYSGAFSTGIAYATWHIGVSRLGGSHASVFQNVVTLVAVLGGWLVLGEPMLTSQLVGGLLMIVGMLCMRYSRR